MKKTFSILLAALLCCCTLIPAFAADSINAVVTISDGSAFPALACADVTVTDKDADGALTIYDALYCAHEQYYKDGAAGFRSTATEYGASLSKLWGKENGYDYGYYVNDDSAWNLTDTVKDGDYVAAFLYTDRKSFSDAYSFFDVKTASVKEGETVTLTLSKLAYMPRQPATATLTPCTPPFRPPDCDQEKYDKAGATILIDGKETAYKTDENGKVTVTFDNAGEHVVSAKAADGIIVPPACKVNVTSLNFLQKIVRFFRNLFDMLKKLFSFGK